MDGGWYASIFIVVGAEILMTLMDECSMIRSSVVRRFGLRKGGGGAGLI